MQNPPSNILIVGVAKQGAKLQIQNNNYSIIEVMQMLDRKELVVNSDYQRGSGIWPVGPSSYFIDTILEKYPFPKIYMYEFLDRQNRSLRKEIVDGQQRIGTIRRFMNDDFAISGESKFSGKKFSELDDETQDAFLSYPVSVDVVRSASRSEILQMFRRMNAFTLPLNEAEKRHSGYQGRFKWFINDVSDELNEFFVEFGVFKSRQIVRMADAALISDCVLAIQRGVISTGPKDLAGLYKKYDVEFPEEDDYRRKIYETFKFIATSFPLLRDTFMMKQYALHSLVTALIHNKYCIEAIEAEFGIASTNRFVDNVENAHQNLLSLAQAHEAKELDGPHGKYVWGCISTTDRRPRRLARVASVSRALGATVPPEVDNLAAF